MAKLTKQEAAANARKIRLDAIHKREYEEAIRKYNRAQAEHARLHPTKTYPETKSPTVEIFEARIAKAQKELKLMGKVSTRKAAIKSITSSYMYMTQNELFLQAIRDYMSVADRNKLRYALSKIKGTKYKQTTINWSEFSYSNALQAMVHVSGKLLVRIAHGKDSTEPDFIEIVEK